MTNKRSKKHTPEQIVAKQRDADVMLNTGKENGQLIVRRVDTTGAFRYFCRALQA